MTASIDDKIVSMKIENTQFLRGVEQSISAYTKLEQTLNKGIATKGLDNVSNNLRGFSLNPITNALSEVSKGWLAMSTIALTALSQITSSVISTGTNMVKSLSLDQITGGFNEYSTNLTAIQTVLANTQQQGTSLDDVNGALQQLNHYSDKTIYNFGEMAKNIGTFTAAGVSLEGSVSSIKGIANLAALSGSSSEQASTAMYQLSQAIAAGRVSLQDWNSVVNAGMGGATFQKALVTTAQAMGTIDSSAVKIEKSTGKMTINGSSFRDSISAIGGEKWLTSDVLTKTLDQFTGDMTDAQLAAEGFNKEQIAAIQQTAATAQDAATKVKTVKQVFDVAKETVGSGWSLTFQRIFGDFEQARSTMTDLSNFLNGIIKHNSNARNKILKDWGTLGGRDKAIEAVKNAWKSLMSVLDPIHDAFRDIFPASTGKDLFQLTKAVNEFFRGLRVGKETGADLQRTFAGFFAVLDIGKQIIGGVFHLLGDLFGAAGDGAGGVLSFTGNIGDLLVKLDEWLKKGAKINAFFTGLGDILAVPIQLIGDLAGALASLFGGSDSGGLSATGDALGSLGDKLAPLAGILNVASDAWDRFSSLISGGVKLFAPFIEGIGKLFSGLGTVIADSMDSGDFSPVLDMINTGLLGAITLLFAKFVKNGFNFSLFGAKGGVFSSIAGSLDALTGSMEAMQANIQAGTLLKIAGAIALITASVVALSLIDSGALTKALGALSVGFAQLLSAMAILVKISGSAGLVKIPAIAAAMVLLSTSILILSGAVAILAQLSWEQLAKGLGAVGVLLLFISGFAQSMSAASGPILRTGIAMIPLAIGLNLLAGAVLVFSTMSWGDMAKGMAGVAGGLLIIAGAMQLMPATMPLTAVGLLLVGVALNAIATSMMLFSSMSWEEIGKGMVGIAGGLVLIAGAMQLMPATLPLTAVGLVLVAGALNGIAAAAKVFATMSWEEMGKAAAALAGSLLIIAGGMYLMTGALPGAAALLVVSAALAILAPVLIALGAMSWEMIAKGLVELAGVFTVLGLAGLILAPLVPVILALAAAIALMGLGMALAGAGMLAFGVGLAALAGAGGAGLAVLKEAILQFIDLMPQMAAAIAVAIIEMVTTIAEHAPEMEKAFTELMSTMLDSAMKLTPKFGQLISKLIKTGLRVLVSYYSDLAEAGLQLIQNLLGSFAAHVGDIADSATDLAINFVKAMARNQIKFVNAALDALIDFMNGFADAITTHSTELNAAGARIAVAIIGGATAGIRAAASEVWNAAQNVLDGIKSHIHMPHIDVNPFGKGKIDVFAQMAEKLGLTQGADSIKEGFDKIDAALKDGLSKTNDVIQKDKEQLNKLVHAGKGGSDEAQKLREEIAKQTKLRKELTDEQQKWNKHMKDERKNLLDLGHQYDDLMGKISDATDALDKAKSDRDSFIKSTTDQFNQRPDIQQGMSLAAYMQEIKRKTEQTQKFMETLQALRQAGLSDESYRQLLAEGTDAQALMEQLLAGGGTAVDAFNAANDALKASAGELASTASTSLFYDAAVAQAQATLDGWTAQKQPLVDKMTEIAKAMVKAMQDALGVDSDKGGKKGGHHGGKGGKGGKGGGKGNRFAVIGANAAESVASGLESGITAIQAASDLIGTASLDTLQATMNRASDMGVLDLSPSITPVLDLTQIQKDAVQIGTMLAAQPLVATVSYEQAASISNDQQAAMDAASSIDTTQIVKEINFNQTIESPDPVDDVAVWRGTKSLLSMAKEALDS